MEEIAKRLNDPAVLPQHAYHRNHATYELVGYVNCLVGCRISGNTEGAALFAERVDRFIAEHPRTPDVAEYYQAVINYVRSGA
ncbi:hypothetical protein QH494_28155 [Sphingomonas sp. AR_OL41]|uniref:hypothetical protein n=1 Tax=Sphingomonas sp. AR_OL41 TaxID=3042729 RepID=UPI00247FEC89|nr:hypothetical protein [Sphingomonas sp. AR_OL41]MDH7976070.1 hypothetical protein [Sphingomonas sp. AR_OL41]